MSLNKLMLIGNLTRDPELRYTPKGTAVAKFGLAVNRKWKDDNGALHEEVMFVDCDAFGRTAENLAQYVKKGTKIFLEGRLKLDQWDDKQTGQKRSKHGMLVERIEFLGTADKSAQPRQTSNDPASQPSPPDDANQLPQDDNIPF